MSEPMLPALPVRPPVAPMLAKLTRHLPDEPGLVYEPKWDGFRGIAFRRGDDVDIRSRNDRQLARYFPEVVAALLRIPTRRYVIDGELVVTTEGGFEFNALMERLHPAASRVALLSKETPASFIAFDLLAMDDDDLRERPFADRRRRLETLLADADPCIHLTPATTDRGTAELWLDSFQGAGLDGVVVKPLDLTYQPGKRAMIKVKKERTADCVVAGFRWFAGEPEVGSLLLGLYDDNDELQHIGIASSFSKKFRRQLIDDLKGLATSLEGHPWEHGFALEGGAMGRLRGSGGRWTPEMTMDWVPLRPELVCEVAYTQIEGHRMRHPGRFLRWRPDRDPPSCRLDQLVTRA